MQFSHQLVTCPGHQGTIQRHKRFYLCEEWCATSTFCFGKHVDRGAGPWRNLASVQGTMEQFKSSNGSSEDCEAHFVWQKIAAVSSHGFSLWFQRQHFARRVAYPRFAFAMDSALKAGAKEWLVSRRWRARGRSLSGCNFCTSAHTLR